MDAVSWMTPRQSSDSPHSWRNQSHITSSTSVSAGDDCHVMPSEPMPTAAMSPSADASDDVRREPSEVHGVLHLHHAGHDHRVELRHQLVERRLPAGGVAANPLRTSPGATWASTGRCSIDGAEVGDPVDQLVPGDPELLRRHAATLGLRVPDERTRAVAQVSNRI